LRDFRGHLFWDVANIFKKIEDDIPEDTAKMTETFLTGLSRDYESKKVEFNCEYEIQETIEYLQKRQNEDLANDISELTNRNNVSEAQKLVLNFEPIAIGIVDDEQGFTAEELYAIELPEIQWIIDGVASQGLTLFAGKPKVGKSFFVLNAAIDLSIGREAFKSILIEQARVLYLALEDTTTTLKDRLHKIIGDDDNWPDRLHCYPMAAWPRADQGGLKKLEKWMEDYPDTKLIIIDTLEKFKKPNSRPGYNYSIEYQTLIPLQELAGKHGISLIVVHHTRKTKADSLFDEIGGTTGLTGAADTLLVMNRTTNPSNREFAFRGRHFGEGETLFKFEDFRFVLIDDANAGRCELSKSRQVILKFLEITDGEVNRKEIVGAVEDKVGKGVDVLLKKLVESENIEKTSYGKYALKGYKRRRSLCEISQKARQYMNRNNRMNEGRV